MKDAKGIRKEIKKLPQTPGVYIYRNDKGRIIYIGKAISLRERVRNYFQDPKYLDTKTQELVRNIAKLEYMKTDSGVEALILEAELIKRYKPRFNIVWRDDKNYIYIKITSEDYPQVSLVRQIVDDKARYIGPFVSAGALRGLLRYVRRIFMFRHCSYDLNEVKGPDSRRSLSSKGWIPASAGMTKEGGNDRIHKVCLQYSIGNCSGPCEEYITKTEYNKNIRQMIKFFEGKTKELEKEFGREMKKAAKAENYEKAALYRNRLTWLKKIRTIKLEEDFDSGQARMTQDKALIGLRDALDLASIPKRIECYDISNIFGKAAVGSMVVFIDGIPARDHYRRFEIKTVMKISDYDMIQEVLRRRFKKLQISHKHFSQIQNSKLKIQKGPDSLPAGRPPEFMLNLIQCGNDKGRGADESFSEIPDLIIIDGGKGQLSSAEKVLDGYNLNLNLVSLAKRREEIFRIDSGQARMTEKDGQNDPALPRLRRAGWNGKFQKIELAEGSESLYLVQRIRDEAHRFAITYHRSKRGKEMAVSNLDVIDGIGLKTKKVLLKTFGSVENIKNASTEDIAGVIGEKLAEKIKENL